MEYLPLLSNKSVSGPPLKTLFWAVCAVGIGGTFQYGYNISIINAPTTQIHTFLNETWYIRYQSTLDEGLLTLIWSIIASVFTLGGLLGTYIGVTAAVKLGRKQTLLLNNILAIFAAVLMGISYPTGLFEFMIAGRFFIGVNAGIGICVQPLYLGEIAPKHIRGFTSVGINIFLTLGILAGQIIGLREFLGGDNLWPFLLPSCCIPAVIQLLTLPYFPESPRYLLIEKRDEYECQKALKTLYGQQHYLIEMQDIQQESNVLSDEKPNRMLELFSDRSIRWQLITIIITNMGQQLSGINAIYFYAEYIFTTAGIPTANIPYVTLGTGICEFLTAVTCGLLIDSVGRRVLIIGGYALMAFWCTILTLTLTFQEFSPTVPYLSMSAIFAFILSFGLGPGGVTNTLTAELFTQSSRSGAFMIGGSVNWLSFFLIGMIFPFIVNGLNQYCFLVFFVECIFIAGFIFFVVPETKNKSFLDIKKDFQKLNFDQCITSSEEEQDGSNTFDAAL